MQHFSEIGEIKSRADAIRLPMGHLADLAGVAPSSITRALQGGTLYATTLKRLEDALLAEEARLRDYLVSLHGCPESKGEEAA